MLRFARDGDTIVVQSMDQLARNLDDLRVQGLTRKGVRVEFVKESLVFTGEDTPRPTSCSPLWVPSPNSNAP
jgi:DNA invertase Pin-like site-specific DNA recombinase